MSLPLVIVTHPLPEEWLQKYVGQFEFVFGPAHQPGFSVKLLDENRSASAVLSLLCDRIGEAEIEQLPNLRVIANLAVGYDNIDLTACRKRGIRVGNTPGVLTDATADLAMALLLASSRGIIPAEQDAREGRWQMWEPAGWLGGSLAGKTLGIYGMGKIGQAVAQRATAFGMTCIYHNRKPVDGIALDYVSFDELLQRSDFISIHAPLNDQSRGRFDLAAFSKMKPGVTLINTGRGPIIQTDDLVQALREGLIQAAALDVTDPEPLPPDHPLYGLRNCLIVPHIGSATTETRRQMTEMALENIFAGLQNMSLPFEVY
jgi:glyoxylate reductase